MTMTAVQKTETMLKVLRELQKLDQEFPLQYAVCLLEISRNEGMSLTHLSLKTGLALSTISRIIGALSHRRQKGNAYGLVDALTSKTERRRKELYLTDKGRSVIEGVISLV